MATGAAGDVIFRAIFDGCISGHDMGIQRRPYHRNCGCELHKSRGHCSHSSRCVNVSYPIRRSWSESSLILAAANSDGSSGHLSTTSPAGDLAGKKNLMRSSTIEDYDHVVLFKRLYSKVLATSSRYWCRRFPVELKVLGTPCFNQRMSRCFRPAIFLGGKTDV